MGFGWRLELRTLGLYIELKTSLPSVRVSLLGRSVCLNHSLDPKA